ncbi:hypothetical protein LSCM1_06936 [Leishmania martiniquensis]|uniref:Uncharacterized protein n=1 Tax=Leishmania martiniquensis TaxID=1580590 RepID=A0A836KU52_9TRYP|nr:hypothetical protein LSCM1_06936 [Leishmania martiniquensis]
MNAAVDAADPRVAPAVQQLSFVAQRVYAVWQRMGIAALDCEQRWRLFLRGSLLPFLDDFCAVQEAAEYNAATENDALLRDVCHLALRLDDAPRQPEVMSIVSLLKEHYASTQQHHPFIGSGGRGSASGNAAGTANNAVKLTATPGMGSGVDRDAAESVPPLHREEFIYLSLPSFTTLLETLFRSGQQGERSDAPPHELVHQGGGGGLETDDGISEQVAHGHGANDCSAAAQVLRLLLHNNTHEGVRQQLQAELDRLQRLADNRLRLLQLLCKQRAIMSRSAQEQVVLRAAYRAKYLGKEEDCSASVLGKQVSRDGDSAMDGRPQRTIAVGEVSACSSRFVSPLTSPKTSGLVARSGVPSSGKCESSSGSTGFGANEDADAIEALVNRPTTSLQDATRAELQLLLSAASCSLDAPHRASGNDGNVDGTLLECRAEGEASSSTWPTCNTMTATTEARATAQTATPPASVCAAAKMVVRGGDPGTPPTAEARATVLEVDVSDITAYGTHQDLALTRIHAEAEAIVRGIDEHNQRMQQEAQEELHALDTLEKLWRTMSARRTSPAASSLTSLTNRSRSEAASQGEAGGPTCSSGDGERAMTQAATAAICAPPLPPLQPEPYTSTAEEIIARYRQLHATYEADVAAQQQQQASPAAKLASLHALSVAESSAGLSSSSLKSSERLTPPTVVGDSDSAGEHNGAHRAIDGLYLPPVVRQVLRAASYAPVLDYVRRARLAFQAHLSAQQDALVEKTMARLRTIYEAYYAATCDKTYAVAPDGELRVAVEEELLETFQAESAAVIATRQHQQRYKDGKNEATRCSDWRGVAAGAEVPPLKPDKVLLSFQRHLAACQQVREQAEDEMELLRLRLHIIQQAAPLVQNYEEILREEAEMRATSRERLLNKKGNMAKQLLQEEKTRRRVAKELPRIVSQLKELVAAWDALQAATDPREDTADVGRRDNDSRGVTVSPPSRSAKAELWIHGHRVRDLLTAPKTTTATPASRLRSRSASSPPPLRSYPPHRSASPAPPALVRHRAEQPLAASDKRTSPHPSRNGSPMPVCTPPSRCGMTPLAIADASSKRLPGRHEATGARSGGAGTRTTPLERSGDSLRHHSNTTSPPVRSRTPPYSQEASRSCKPAPFRSEAARVPSRSPPPLPPQLPRRGLSLASSNTHSQTRKGIAHPSMSPSPPSTSAIRTKLGSAPPP